MLPADATTQETQNRAPPLAGTIERPLVVDAEELSDSEGPPIIDLDRVDGNGQASHRPARFSTHNMNITNQLPPISELVRHYRPSGPTSFLGDVGLPRIPDWRPGRIWRTGFPQEAQHRGRQYLQEFLGHVGPAASWTPPAMDYDAVAIHMGEVAGPAVAPDLPAPTYDAPDPPRKGFSRCPQDDEVAICPNCQDELGVGGDELKRQVWVVKSCGHVSVHLYPRLVCRSCYRVLLFDFGSAADLSFLQAYCGECSKYRKQKKSEPPVRIQPFSKCVIEDCKSSVSGPKSMIQMYISS